MNFANAHQHLSGSGNGPVAGSNIAHLIFNNIAAANQAGQMLQCSTNQPAQNVGLDTIGSTGLNFYSNNFRTAQLTQAFQIN